MKKLQFFLIIILLAPATVCLSQDALQLAPKIGWTEVYDEKLNYSVTFPSDFLVDNEPQKVFPFSSLTISSPEMIDTIEKPDIIGHQRSVSMVLKIYDLKVSRAKDYFYFFIPNFPDKPFQNFRFDDFEGRTITLDNDKKLGAYIVAAVKNKMIVISAYADGEDFEIYERFLTSIKINGKTFLKSDSKKEYADKIDRVPISQLATSPEILEALNQKSEKRDFSSKQIQIEPENKERNKEDSKVSRPVILLRRPKKSPYLEPGQKFSGLIKAKVNFQNDGRIGDVIFLADAPKLLLKRLFADIQEIKFLPAKLEGKKINFTKLLEYQFNAKYYNLKF